MNKMRRNNKVEEVVEEAPSEEILLLREISQKLSK